MVSESGVGIVGLSALSPTGTPYRGLNMATLSRCNMQYTFVRKNAR